MARFSPTDSAFSGFRFVREKPRLMLAWTSFYILIALTVAIIIAALAGTRWAEVQTLSQATVIDQKVLDVLRDVGPAAAVALLAGAILVVGLRAAVLRAFLGAPAARWGGIRFTEDELRLLGVYVLLFATFMVAGFALIAVVAAAGAGLAAAPTAADIAGGVLALLAVAVLLFLLVRLSLAPAVAIAEKKIDLRRAWTLTRGRFWPLLAAYVLALAVTAVVYLLVVALFAALMGAAALATGGNLAEVSHAVAGDFDGLPPLIVGLAVLLSLAQAWLAVLLVAVQTGVMADAYRAFSKD